MFPVTRLPLLLLGAFALGACSDGSGTPGQPALPEQPAPSTTFTLGGSISGLAHSGLSLANGDKVLQIASGATTFDFGAVLQAGSAYSITVQSQPVGQTCSIANGSGIASGANVANAVVTCAHQSFRLGGSITGLVNAGLKLTNGTDLLAVQSGASSFTLPTEVAYGSSYEVTVAAQPPGLACGITHGTGTMPAEDVVDVAVTCTSQPFNVGGSVSGLVTSGLVLANGADTVAVPAGEMQFTMPAPVPFGQSYDVQVQSHPTGFTCAVAQGSGTVPAGDVTDVSVTCANRTYTLGGSISGLGGPGLVLANGADLLPVPAGATSFLMPAVVPFGGSYSVTVHTQPAGMHCSVNDGAGTMPEGGVSNVGVTCALKSHTLGGTITGLSTGGLLLANGSDTVAVAANATVFTLPQPVAVGGPYAVTVQTQPGGLACNVASGSGTMPDADVTDVAVTCAYTNYTISGVITGLATNGLVLANAPASDTLAVASSATTFTMPVALDYNDNYAITVQTQPSGQYCEVTSGNASGTIAADTEVEVNCGVIFTTPGPDSWIVPPDANTIRIITRGAGGGSGSGGGTWGSRGGAGAQVNTDLPVAPGEVLNLFIGGGGGGGSGGANRSGGGGGASTVNVGTPLQIIAGGGGGGGASDGGWGANGGGGGVGGTPVAPNVSRTGSIHGDGGTAYGGGSGIGGAGGPGAADGGSGNGGSGGSGVGAGGLGEASGTGVGGTGSGTTGGGGGGGYGGGGGGTTSGSGGAGGGSIGPAGSTYRVGGAGGGGTSSGAGQPGGDGSIAIFIIN